MSTITDLDPTRQATAADGTSEQFGTNVGELVESRLDLSVEAEDVSSNDSGPLSGSRCNVGRTEQKFRIAAGTALLATASFAPLSRGWRIGLAALGVAELITGATRYCPVSQLLGINTCRQDER